MRRMMRSVLCLLLALCMALSLAACGEKQQGGETVQPGQNEPEQSEYVYASTVKELVTDQTGDTLTPRVYLDDGFYATLYTKIGENIPEGVTPEYEGQYDVYGYKLYFVDYDGKVREIDYTPMEPAENEEGYLNFYSGSDLGGILVNDDGSLCLMESLFAYWFEGTEDQMDDDNAYQLYVNTYEYYFRSITPDGQELGRVKLEEIQDEDGNLKWINFSNSVRDDKGNILVASDRMLLAFAPDGSLAYQIETENWVDSIVRSSDGQICVCVWGDDGMDLLPLDAEHAAFGEAIKAPRDVFNFISGSGEYDLLYNNGSNLFGFDLETGESSKILNWLDCDINGNRMYRCSLTGDGRIVGVYSTYSRDTVKTELVRIEKVPADSLPKKETVTMATLYSGEISDIVIDFNRHSDTTRIRIIDYSEYNDYENGDYDAGRTKLLTEIMAGNVPDILPLSELPYTQLAAKGLLEDLYPYLDADPELSRDDYLPNILHAMEVEGKLCEISTGFYVSTLVGASSVVGDTPGWTYAQFRQALASMPDGCEPLERYVTRDSILETLLYLEMDNLVDWTTGKCRFDSQDFIEMLNFVTIFPESYEYQEGDYSGSESEASRIRDGRQMLVQVGFSDFNDINYSLASFDGPTTFIGYPCNSGSGHILNLQSCYAMSSSCAHKDAAWQFLRSMMTEQAQYEQYSLPYHKEAFQKKLTEAMTPEYEKDEEGNYLLDEDGKRIEISRGSWWSDDGETHYFYAMTQEQADQILEVINSIDRAADTNSSINQIVQEMVQPFYAGQKSAEEVARLIQSKVNIYVNEQR